MKIVMQDDHDCNYRSSDLDVVDERFQCRVRGADAGGLAVDVETEAALRFRFSAGLFCLFCLAGAIVLGEYRRACS